jgi:putative transcription factor
VVSDCSVKVKRAREEMGLTQEVLAKLTGEKVSVIRRIEAGKLKPTLDLAKRLERVLKVSLVEEVEVAKGSEQLKLKADLTLGDVVVVRERGEGRRG